MAEAQTFCQVEFDDKNPITFAPNEWTIFKDELERQFTEGKRYRQARKTPSQ